MHDQAQRLRSMVAQSQAQGGRNTRVITVTSGKGGVGKSNFTLNYALELAKQGKKVVILDGDVGFANIDVLMGVKPQKTLADLISKQATMQDILETGPLGVQFIAGGSGFQDLLDVKPEQFEYVVEQLAGLQGHVDYVLIDTGAGLNQQTLRLILAADDIYVVLTPEPTAITDAYSLIKMVANRDPSARMSLVINRAQTPQEGREAADKISLVAERFLDLKISTLGIVHDDPNVTKSVKKQTPFLLSHPDSIASRSIAGIVDAHLHNKQLEEQSAKGMKHFLQRMVRLFR